MSSSYRQELDRWLSQLDVKAERVLDIGGAQLPVKGRTKSWDVGEYMIADLEWPHVEKARAQAVLDLNQPYAPELKNMVSKFDLIFCLEVFEYVFDPLNAMEYIEMFLPRNGTAWVTFPSFYPHHQPIEDDSLRYMEGGIRKLANAVGLKVERILKRRPETNLLQQFFSAERMRAAKGFDHNVTGYIVEFMK